MVIHQSVSMLLSISSIVVGSNPTAISRFIRVYEHISHDGVLIQPLIVEQNYQHTPTGPALSADEAEAVGVWLAGLNSRSNMLVQVLSIEYPFFTSDQTETLSIMYQLIQDLEPAIRLDSHVERLLASKTHIEGFMYVVVDAASHILRIPDIDLRASILPMIPYLQVVAELGYALGVSPGFMDNYWVDNFDLVYTISQFEVEVRGVLKPWRFRFQSDPLGELRSWRFSPFERPLFRLGTPRETEGLLPEVCDTSLNECIVLLMSNYSGRPDNFFFEIMSYLLYLTTFEDLKNRPELVQAWAPICSQASRVWNDFSPLESFNMRSRTHTHMMSICGAASLDVQSRVSYFLEHTGVLRWYRTSSGLPTHDLLGSLGSATVPELRRSFRDPWINAQSAVAARVDLIHLSPIEKRGLGRFLALSVVAGVFEDYFWDLQEFFFGFPEVKRGFHDWFITGSLQRLFTTEAELRHLYGHQRMIRSVFMNSRRPLALTNF
jgi:hypothetical protein